MAHSTRSKSNQSLASDEFENPSLSGVETDIINQRMILKEKQLKEQAEHIARRQAEFEQRQSEQPHVRELLSAIDALTQKVNTIQERLTVTEQRQETATTHNLTPEQREPHELRSMREHLVLPETRNDSPARRSSSTALDLSPLRLKDVADAIPKYDGQRTSVFQFCQACERALRLIPAHQEKHLVQLIMGRLSGHAYTIMQDSNYLNVEPLLRKLKRILGPNKSLNQYRGELGNAYMRPNEPILDYITRIKELQTAIVDSEVEQRGQRLDEDMMYCIERDVLDSFINGLPSELLVRIKVEGYTALDLDDAFARAIQLSKTLETEALRRRPAFAPPPVKLPRRDAPAPQPFIPRQVLPRTGAPPFIRPLIPGQAGPNAPRQVICYYCKNVMSECRKKAYNEQQASRREPEPVPSTSRNQPSGNDSRAPVNPSVQRDTAEKGRKAMTMQVDKITTDHEPQ